MKIVLVTPEIPFTAGSIKRTCVALDLELIVIKPYGFSPDTKTVFRSGVIFASLVSKINSLRIKNFNVSLIWKLIVAKALKRMNALGRAQCECASWISGKGLIPPSARSMQQAQYDGQLWRSRRRQPLDPGSVSPMRKIQHLARHRVCRNHFCDFFF